MLKQIKKQVVFLGGALGLLLVISPFLWSQNVDTGNVLGFVYEKDGTTPVQGALVKLQNIRSGNIYESTPTDSQGSFLIQQIKSGVYLYGVSASEGDYNCDGMIGVRIPNKGPARMALALSRYDEEKESKGNNPNENTADEYLVGEVLNYNPNNQMAQVRIIRGMLEKDDQVHILGKDQGEEKGTDFNQKVSELKFNGSEVKRLFVEQVGLFKTKEPVREGDLVYLGRNKGGLIAFLAAPCGWAALVSLGTAGYVVYDRTTKANGASAYK